MGDFLQLPPVTTPEERSILQALKYRSPYAFSARLLENVQAKVVELEQVYRQPETEFIDILAKIRTAEDFHSAIRVLNDRYAGPHRDDAVPDRGERSIDPAMPGIVLCRHHSRADFQFQSFGNRKLIALNVEISFDPRIEKRGRSRGPVEAFAIVTLCRSSRWGEE